MKPKWPPNVTRYIRVAIRRPSAVEMMRPFHYLLEHKLSLLIVLFVLVAATSSIILPPFEAPDELFHFAYIQHVTITGSLPVYREGESPMWHQEGGQAPGYYLAAAALTFWIDQSDFPILFQRMNPHAAIGYATTPANPNFIIHHADEGWPWSGSILALHIARFFSVALGAITVWAIYRTLLLLLDENAALLGAAFVAFIPQFAFISGAASNDNAITAAAALLLWRLVRFLRDAPASPSAEDPDNLTRPWRAPRPYLVLGLVLGFALLSKHAGVTLAGLTFIVLATVAVRARSWRLLVQGGALVALVALLVGGWWYLRNFQLYGDLLAMNVWESNVGRQDALSGAGFLAEVRGLEYSFWGLFGWFSVSYPQWMYRLFRLLEGLVLVGLLIAALRRLRGRGESLADGQGWRALAVGILLLWLLLLTISWLAFMQISLAAQGRLFFPALPVFALLATTGLRAWRRLGRPPLLGWMVVAGLMALSVATPWWILRPAYHRSAPLDVLPEDARPTGIHFGDSLRLEGYWLSQEQVAAGDTLDIVLFWRAMEPVESAYSVAVKGFGRAGELVARHDSYPDSGRWSTTEMREGQLIADRISLPLREEARMPAEVRLTVDLYEYETLEMLPATSGEESIASPVTFARVVLREAPSPPAPSSDFVWRPADPRLTIEGGAVEMAFAWEVGQTVSTDLQAFFHLVPAPGEPPVAQRDFEPLEGTMPTTLWWPGDRLPDEVSMQLPTDVAEGEYLLVLGLYDLETLQRVEGVPGTDAWPVGTLRWDGRTWQQAQ